MAHSRGNRRAFLKVGSAALLGSAIAPGAARAAAGDADNAAPEAGNILNRNERMTYRRLGKTGYMISEVALGGHGGQSVDDRVPVLEKAVELGINYVDNNIAEECDLYGAAMARSRTAPRDRWFIGFASWPEKITPDFEDQLTPDGMMRNIEARLKSYRTDVLDLWRPVGATWGEGQNRLGTLLPVHDKALNMVVEVFDKARRQGKVRHLGVSAHNPQVFRNVLEKYPQFEVIIFPYLFLTKELGGDSLLKLAQDKNVGVIGLKPFGAGTTFGIKPREIQGHIDRRAHVLVREMLQESRLSAIIPGVNTPEQLEENVRGSYEKAEPPTPDDRKALDECRRNYFAHLTPEYRWLHHWHYV